MTDPAFLGVLAAGAACGDFWQFCAFWSLADFAASKCRHGDNLALLAFGAVSLRLLDLGDPYFVCTGFCLSVRDLSAQRSRTGRSPIEFHERHTSENTY